MRLNRRAFLGSSAAALGASACSPAQPAPPATIAPASGAGSAPAAIQALKPMTDGIQRITADERAARVEKARKLMVDNKLDAIYLEGGSSLFYFTGVRWGPASSGTADPTRVASASRSACASSSTAV